MDDDVAAMIERLREEKKQPLKVVVNQALRDGLFRMIQPQPERPKFVMHTRNLGKSLVGSLDNVAEVLALVEGEDYK